MAIQPRACPVCGRALAWTQRSDAKFCSPRCRQRDFRSRHCQGRPSELRREPLDPEDVAHLRSQMPPGAWRYVELLLIEYADQVPCLRCNGLAVEVIGVQVRLRGRRRLVDFCSDDCLLDTAHAQRHPET